MAWFSLEATLMEQSNDALQQLRGSRQNNYYISLLIKQFRSSVGIVPFVGAGLSKPFGFPLWSEFLRQQADLAGIPDEINELIANGRYEEAADRLIDERDRLRFNDVVRQTFGRTPLNTLESMSAAAVVPALATGVVLTTNFDRVLESLFRKAKVPFE
jgi:SIR2-like domain